MQLMRKKVMTLTFILTLVIGSLLGSYPFGVDKSYAEPVFSGGGTGSIDDPYQIATADQLNEVRNFLDAGNYFILVADIDLSGFSNSTGWAPIGTGSAPFKGNVNGNGFTIKILLVTGRRKPSSRRSASGSLWGILMEHLSQIRL